MFNDICDFGLGTVVGAVGGAVTVGMTGDHMHIRERAEQFGSQKNSFQMVADGIGILGSDFRKTSPNGSRRERHF